MDGSASDMIGLGMARDRTSQPWRRELLQEHASTGREPSRDEIDLRNLPALLSKLVVVDPAGRSWGFLNQDGENSSVESIPE